MKIIDSHLHFWDPDNLTYRWLSDVPAIGGFMGPQQFADTGVTLEGAVFVQADCEPAQAMAEVDWIYSLDFPILGVVAYSPLELGDTPHIQALKANPKVVGIRRNVQDEPDGFMTSGGYLAGMIATARAGLTLDMCIRARQLPEMLRAVAAVFAAVPDARIVLDHLGKPDIRTHKANIDGDNWSHNIKQLSEYPNLFCKLSGLVTEADHTTWTPEQVRPYIDHVIAAFGPERCLFGGDWPVVNLAGGYGRWLETMTAALAALNPADQSKIWSGTARRFYRI
ncbi:MAG: amidohydrolase family protein [Asticcacaulis sp.]